MRILRVPSTCAGLTTHLKAAVIDPVQVQVSDGPRVIVFQVRMAADSDSIAWKGTAGNAVDAWYSHDPRAR